MLLLPFQTYILRLCPIFYFLDSLKKLHEIFMELISMHFAQNTVLNEGHSLLVDIQKTRYLFLLWLL